MIDIGGVEIDLVVFIGVICGAIIGSAGLKKALITLNPFKSMFDKFKVQEKKNEEFMQYFKNDQAAIRELQEKQKETDVKYKKMVDYNNLIAKALMGMMASLSKLNNDSNLSQLHNEITNELQDLHAKYDKSNN